MFLLYTLNNYKNVKMLTYIYLFIYIYMGYVMINISYKKFFMHKNTLNF